WPGAAQTGAAGRPDTGGTRTLLCGRSIREHRAYRPGRDQEVRRGVGRHLRQEEKEGPGQEGRRQEAGRQGRRRGQGQGQEEEGRQVTPAGRPRRGRRSPRSTAPARPPAVVPFTAGHGSEASSSGSGGGAGSILRGAP